MLRMLARTFGTSGAAAFRSSRRNRFLISLSSMRRSSRLIRRRSPLSRRPIVIAGLLAEADEDAMRCRIEPVGQAASLVVRREEGDVQAERPELKALNVTGFQPESFDERHDRRLWQ